MGKGKPKVQTVPTTTTTEPPAFLAPFLEQETANFAGNYGAVPYNHLMRQGLNQGADAATQTWQTIDPALEHYRAVVGGDFLQPDAIQQAARPFVEDFAPQLMSDYALANRSGSGMENYEFGQGVGNIVARQYQTERDRQQQMAAAAPGFEQLRLSPFDTFYQLGSQMRGEDLERMAAMADRLGMLSGAGGGLGTVTGQNPYVSGGGSGLGSVLGTGLTLAGIATGNPGLGMAGGLFR